jgi:hypothetical protein
MHPQLNTVNNFYEKAIYKTENNWPACQHNPTLTQRRRGAEKANSWQDFYHADRRQAL